MKTYFKEEFNNTVDKINGLNEKGCFCFNLVTDSHLYSFENPISTQPLHTIENMKEVNAEIDVDCMFHLGDIMWSTQKLRDEKYWSENFAEKFLIKARDLYISANENCYFIPGNHDDIDAAEPHPVRWYKKMVEFQKEKLSNYVENKPYYSVDFPMHKIRAICIMSCFMDETGCWYGYYEEQVNWLEKVLLETPDDYKILLFSHIDPVGPDRSTRLDNEKEFISVLEAFAKGEKFDGEVFSVDFTKKTTAEILAMFVGHGHYDLTITENPFLIVERACNHLHQINPDDDWSHPEGAVSPRRKVESFTEDLWDTVIYNPEKNTIDIVRFGAGEDAHYDLRKDEKK